LRSVCYFCAVFNCVWLLTTAENLFSLGENCVAIDEADSTVAHEGP
jgi:hypothetical protein